MSAQPIDDGGPAFPQISFDDAGLASKAMQGGVSVRDYFAAAVQADDRLVKCVRAMDDRALVVFGEGAEFFARFPDSEREEHITEIEPGWPTMTEVEKVEARLLLEARAIARARYMQADAMLAERSKEAPNA